MRRALVLRTNGDHEYFGKAQRDPPLGRLINAATIEPIPLIIELSELKWKLYADKQAADKFLHLNEWANPLIQPTQLIKMGRAGGPFGDMVLSVPGKTSQATILEPFRSSSSSSSSSENPDDTEDDSARFKSVRAAFERWRDKAKRGTKKSAARASGRKPEACVFPFSPSVPFVYTHSHGHGYFSPNPPPPPLQKKTKTKPLHRPDFSPDT